MYLVIFLAVGFLAGVAVSLLWLKIALAMRWFDVPNQRSSHTRPTPKGAGMGFALAFACFAAVLAWRGILPADQAWLVLPGLGLAVTGFIDDVRELGVLPRIGLQALAVITAFLLLPDVRPLSGELPPALALVILGTGWVWLINLYNFMDGIDGLAASEAIFVSLGLAWFALDAGLHGSSVLLLTLGVIVAGFLYFNWAPASLFMGDAGSNFLGYSLAAYGLVLVIAGAMTIWTLLILLGVFVADATLTLLKRMRAGLVWYHGHRSHAYQLLAGAHQSHSVVVVAVTGINLLWLLPLAWASARLEQWGMALAMLAFIPLLVLVNHCHARYLAGGMQ